MSTTSNNLGILIFVFLAINSSCGSKVEITDPYAISYGIDGDFSGGISFREKQIVFFSYLGEPEKAHNYYTINEYSFYYYSSVTTKTTGVFKKWKRNGDGTTSCPDTQLYILSLGDAMTKPVEATYHGYIKCQ